MPRRAAGATGDDPAPARPQVDIGVRLPAWANEYVYVCGIMDICMEVMSHLTHDTRIQQRQQQGPEHAAQVPIRRYTQWYMIDHTTALFIAIAMHAVKR